MKSDWTIAIALFTVLAGGCVTQTSESTHANVMPANCIHPTSSETGIAGCEKGMSAITRQSVAADRCVESILLRDTRHGALHRAVLC